jgi:small GTP-binding protein
MTDSSEGRVNINVGVLGHVDSGKTSLVKALSTSLSTAALDKNPQSQQRGITLDLGFSSFTIPIPSHLQNEVYDKVQITLVDCPGHASLIRTIIGGAQIIDMMLLVVDANKGIQTQTAECIVIGEITTDKLIIVLNKIDAIPEAEREQKIEKVSRTIRKVFQTTKFMDAPIVLTAAAVGGEKAAAVASDKNNMDLQSRRSQQPAIVTSGIDDLVDMIRSSIAIPVRNYSSPLYYAIDHCFAIKGHGTVLTGTVLSGSVNVGSIIEIPNCQVQRKVKSMQMFRKPVKSAKQGDRVGICVTNLDPNLIERGIAAAPGSVPLLTTVICMIKKVRFFRPACRSSTKFHVSIGHSTVVAAVTFYGAAELAEILGTTRSGMLKGGKAGTGGNQRSANGSDGDEQKRQGDTPALNTGTHDGINNTANETDVGDTGKELVDATMEMTLDLDSNWPALELNPKASEFMPGHLLQSNAADGNGYANEGHIEDSMKHAHDPSRKGGKDMKGSKGRDDAGSRQSALNATYHRGFPTIDYNWDADFEYQDELVGSDSVGGSGQQNLRYGYEPVQWAVMQFQHPVYCPLGSLVIGSRLDTDVKETSGLGASHQCRLAFYGPVRESITEEDLHRIQLYHWKHKEGEVFRLTDVKSGLCSELIGWKMFSEGSSIHPFIGE